MDKIRKIRLPFYRNKKIQNVNIININNKRSDSDVVGYRR